LQSVEDLCILSILRTLRRSPCTVKKIELRMHAGTGSSGATIRMYVEQYVAPDAGPEKLHADAAKALEPLVNVALTLSKMKELTGREKPTVIT
jgi:hypothetical protein